MSFFKKIKNSKSFSIFTSHSSINGGANHPHKTFDNTINSIANTNTLNSTYSNGSPFKFETSHPRTLVIYHIDSETEGTFSLTVKDDDLGETVIDRVCDHYSLTDYKEYFGLKFTLVDSKGDYEIFWVDPFKKIEKQLKNTNNILTFRVKHFPGKPELIESEYVRYLIFLQIRNYLLKGDLQLSLVDETQLAAYAVQASIGDYDDELHKDNYLNQIQFLSHKTIKAEESIREYHKQLKGKTPAEMELAFLEKASKFDTYGAELIVVKNNKNVLINFGVSHNGIITFLYGHSPNLAKICLYPWTQIGKITYEGKKLEVHAHTPDNNNSEVIKKHVMTFKCNNDRICKHLWKFILDQKAFFNFKKGTDVPRVKSSSSLFHHKSKFRFSGRCESELIASQAQSLSYKNLDTSLNTTNNSTSFERSATLNNASTFKRRTFISPYRPTSKRCADQNTSSDNDQKASNSDSNNNDLNKMDQLNVSQTSSNSTKKAGGSSETASTNTQQTVIIKPDPVEEAIEEVSHEPSFTSTPQIISKHMLKETEQSNKPNGHVNNQVLIEDEDEIFYDHDEIQCPDINSIGLFTPNGKLAPNNSNPEESGQKSYLKYFVVLACFGFMTYWLFFSNVTSSSLVTRLTNNIYFLSQLIKFKLVGFFTNSDYSRNSLNPRWVQWPVFTNSSLDPLITWFLSKYRPN